MKLESRGNETAQMMRLSKLVLQCRRRLFSFFLSQLKFEKTNSLCLQLLLSFARRYVDAFRRLFLMAFLLEQVEDCRRWKCLRFNYNTVGSVIVSLISMKRINESIPQIPEQVNLFHTFGNLFPLLCTNKRGFWNL